MGFRFHFAFVMAFFIAGCSADGAGAGGAQGVAAVPTGAQSGEWLSHGLSAGEQRHSQLDQINIENASQVGLAFAFEDFVVRGRTHRGAQATPLMEGGVLYFTGPWSVVYAADAETGAQKWVYDPEVEGRRARVACCDAVNRGVALHQNMVIVATLEGYLVALDKSNGEPIWKVDTLTDREASYTITGAPRIAGDLVVIGNGGAELGVRGYVTAYDLKTGEQAWRFFTVPSAGPDENSDVTAARATWAEDTPWDFGGGGTAWDSMVYDEALGIFYVGTGNGSPWPVWLRGTSNSADKFNDNLYVSSIVALDAKTGRVKWHYQTTPGDSWDYTATQHMILADLEWRGEPRKVIMQAPKNGMFYTLDRETGELLSAKPYVPVSWTSGVDEETGRPTFLENADYSKQDRVIAPGPLGGHNWPPMAFSQDTGLVYIPTLEMALKYSVEPSSEGYVDFSRNERATAAFPDPKADAKLLEGNPEPRLESRVIAWDPVAAEIRWKSDPIPYWSGGMLSTSGGLVISGSASGMLNFYDNAIGKLVHAIDTGTVITAPPMTYQIGGTQYIAVVAGFGGAMIPAGLPGFATMKYQNRERLLVFKLDGGKVSMPPALTKPEPQPIATGLPTDTATLALGQAKYARYCADCHMAGPGIKGFPDLWNMSPEVHDNFDQIVLGGAYEYAGMASYGDVLSAKDTLAIRAFIADSRRQMVAETASFTRSVH